MIKKLSLRECASCGFIQKKWTGSCENCLSWNSFHEKMQIVEKDKKFDAKKTVLHVLNLKM